MFGGFALNEADENARKAQIAKYLSKHGKKYSNALTNYRDLILSTKFLLNLNPTDPTDDVINVIGNYLDDSFFVIDELSTYCVQ